MRENTSTSSVTNASSSSANRTIKFNQEVAILVDGNNIERSIHSVHKNHLPNWDIIIPRILNGRCLKRFMYFKEGNNSISPKLADRIKRMYMGEVVPCHKSADVPLTIQAVQMSHKLDCIIICSGDSDYIELIRHLKYNGVRVEVLAMEISLSAMIKEEADTCHVIYKEDTFLGK